MSYRATASSLRLEQAGGPQGIFVVFAGGTDFPHSYFSLQGRAGARPSRAGPPRRLGLVCGEGWDSDFSAARTAPCAALRLSSSETGVWLGLVAVSGPPTP